MPGGLPGGGCWSFDLTGTLIECAVEIDLSVFSSSDPFVCNRCYKRLLRFEKAKTNLQSLQEEIKEDLKKGANRTKRLSRNSAEKDWEIENINVPIELSTALQVQQRSAAKSLKFKQFLTTSTSSNAENDRIVGESYDKGGKFLKKLWCCVGGSITR